MNGQQSILIVDPLEEVRDSISNTFDSDEVTVMIAEEKSLSRAKKYLDNDKLDFLILGPNLSYSTIKQFIQETYAFDKFPTILIVGHNDEDTFDDTLFEGVAAKLKMPITSSGVYSILSEAEKAFKQKKKSLTEEKENKSFKKAQDQSSADKQITNSAYDLSMVLSKLSTRLNDLSFHFSSLPKDTTISMSIPEAVNAVIGKASRLRSGYEKEDIKKIIDEIVSTKTK